MKLILNVHQFLSDNELIVIKDDQKYVEMNLVPFISFEFSHKVCLMIAHSQGKSETLTGMIPKSKHLISFSSIGRCFSTCFVFYSYGADFDFVINIGGTISTLGYGSSVYQEALKIFFEGG